MENTSVKTMKKEEKGFFAFADFYGGGGQALIGVLYFSSEFELLSSVLLIQSEKKSP